MERSRKAHYQSVSKMWAKYRVIKIKENSVDVEWKHELEVAVQPKRNSA